MVAFTSASIALLAALPSALASRYVIKPAAFDDLCLVPAGNNSGSEIVVANCTGDLIFWNFNQTTLINTNTTACVDQKDGKHKSGNPIQMWECVVGNPNQAFHIASREDNATSYSIKWQDQPFCLDLTDGQGVEGTKVQAWRCAQNNINQKWTFYDATEANVTEAVDEEDDSAAVYNAYLASLFTANVTETPVETEEPADIVGARRRHTRRVTFGSH